MKVTETQMDHPRYWHAADVSSILLFVLSGKVGNWFGGQLISSSENLRMIDSLRFILMTRRIDWIIVRRLSQEEPHWIIKIIGLKMLPLCWLTSWPTDSNHSTMTFDSSNRRRLQLKFHGSGLEGVLVEAAYPLPDEAEQKQQKPNPW